MDQSSASETSMPPSPSSNLIISKIAHGPVVKCPNLSFFESCIVPKMNQMSEQSQMKMQIAVLQVCAKMMQEDEQQKKTITK